MNKKLTSTLNGCILHGYHGFVTPRAVIPAQAGIQTLLYYGSLPPQGQAWIPACAGMTEERKNKWENKKCGGLYGFTLIELLLYVGISSIMLLIISAFLSLLIESRIKNQTVAEVEQQGVQIMEAITQIARNAENINTPDIGASAPSLSLDVIAAGNDPIVFDLSGGIIRIAEGAGAPIALTNARVAASALVFQNLSFAGTPGTVRIQFTLTHINPAGGNEYSFAKTFVGSATLRQP